nr:cinnamoyl-CoA reductase 2-like [Tanacetum cinerariifolium]
MEAGVACGHDEPGEDEDGDEDEKDADMDEKYAHLKSLEKASENLKLFKADLLDYESLCAAITECDGVFHTASLVELIEPAVKGILNVLKACCEVNVKKVVYVSSVTASCMVPNRPDRPLDETFWSDQEFCRTNNVF